MRSGDASPVTTSAGRWRAKAFPSDGARRPTRPPRRVCRSATMALRRGQPLRCQSSSACAASAPLDDTAAPVFDGRRIARARRHRPRAGRSRRPARAQSRARLHRRGRRLGGRQAEPEARTPPGARAHVERQPHQARQAAHDREPEAEAVAATLGARAALHELVEDARLQRGSMPTPVSRTSMRQPGAPPAQPPRQQHAAGRYCTSRRWRAGCARCARPGGSASARRPAARVAA